MERNKSSIEKKDDWKHFEKNNATIAPNVYILKIKKSNTNQNVKKNCSLKDSKDKKQGKY